MDEDKKQKIIDIVLSSEAFENAQNFILQNFKKTKDELNGRINELQEEIKNIRISAKKVSDENYALNQKIADLEQKNHELQAQKDNESYDNLALRNEIRNKEQKISYLNSENESLRKSNNDLNKKINELQQMNSVVQQKAGEEIQTFKVQIDKMNQELNDKNNKIQEKTADFEKLKNENTIFINAREIFKIYENLSDGTKDQLKSVFSQKTFEGFVSNGLQWENLTALWNFIKQKVIEKKDIDSDNLLTIFRFFFKFYNYGFEIPRYELIEPQLGTKFDRNICFILGTSTDGIISKVNLPGYKDTVTDQINKAIVTVA